jgi:RHS repeat-associated protein
MKKYYYAGATRVTMRTGSGTGTTGINWLFGDHLGSQSITTDIGGNKSAEVRFKAWGEDRYTSGATPTSYRYTGQRWETSLSISFYGARWYDPYLNRWNQPDSIIPQGQGVQAWDRYAYVNNNPVRFNDPSGHVCSDPEAPYHRCDGGPNRNYFGNTGNNTQSNTPIDGSLGGNAEDNSEVQDKDVTSKLSLKQRVETTIFMVPFIVTLELVLPPVTTAVSTALALDPEPVTKAILLSTDILLNLSEVALSLALVDYTHWVITGNLIHKPEDLVDWQLRP